MTLNNATVLTFSRTQQTVAHSAAEAELNGIISGACETLGIKTLMEELRRNTDAEIRSDSTAGISIASRLGQGRLKHLELKQLAIQAWVRKRVLRLAKVDTAHNKSDILTKNLVQKTHEYHREGLGVRGDVKSITLIRGGGAHPGGGWPSIGRGLRVCLGGLIALLSGEVDATPEENPEAEATWHSSVTTVCFTSIVLYFVHQMFSILKVVTGAVAAPRQPPAARTTRGIGIQAGAVVEAHDLVGPSTIQRTRRAIENCTVDELKVVLRHQGEMTSGSKEVLIARAQRVMLWQIAPDDQDVAALSQIAAFGAPVPGSCYVIRALSLRAIEGWQQHARTAL